MERKKIFNELIKYIVLSYSAFQFRIQPDEEKKIKKSPSLIFPHLHPLFSKPRCSVSLVQCPPTTTTTHPLFPSHYFS